MKILVSNCLLGKKCRYKGDDCKNEKVLAFIRGHEVFGVCPEQMGGLPTPRDPGERVGDKVLSNKGKDITAEYSLGAQKALSTAKENGVDLCVLKAKSPSCGCGVIYDGTFSGNLTSGDGVTTELLKANGFKVVTENDLPDNNI